MLASQRRTLDEYQSKTAFMRANQTDFPANSPGDRNAQSLEAEIQAILTLAAKQSSNVMSQHLGVKADNLDRLKSLLRKMNRAADAMGDDHADLENVFRLPRRRSEQTWLAAARAFYTDSANYNADFLDYDLPATFRADLMTLVSQIENANDAADNAGAENGGATGAMVEAFSRAGKSARRLNAIVENKYADNPQKLAEWHIAAHRQAAPAHTSDTTDTPEKPV